VAQGPRAGPRKKAREEGRTIVGVDESGFSLRPARVRTDAPRGKTPTLTVPLTRDHLSAIGALTPAGRLLLRVLTRAFQGPDVVRFLRHRRRHLPGKPLVVWDGSPIHRCQAVKDFLAHGGAGRIHLAPLPGDAPDLNPAEGVWRQLKRVERRNRRCHDLPELTGAFRHAAARLRHKRPVLQACIQHAGYPV